MSLQQAVQLQPVGTTASILLHLQAHLRSTRQGPSSIWSLLAVVVVGKMAVVAVEPAAFEPALCRSLPARTQSRLALEVQEQFIREPPAAAQEAAAHLTLLQLLEAVAAVRAMGPKALVAREVPAVAAAALTQRRRADQVQQDKVTQAAPTLEAHPAKWEAVVAVRALLDKTHPLDKLEPVALEYHLQFPAPL